MDGPRVDSNSPTAIITAPPMTVQRTPTRSATRPMMMPPNPAPTQTSAPASAGIERSPLTSAAMFFSATTVIHGAPKATAMTTSTTVATTQDWRVSTDDSDGDCSMNVALLARPAGLAGPLGYSSAPT